MTKDNKSIPCVWTNIWRIYSATNHDPISSRTVSIALWLWFCVETDRQHFFVCRLFVCSGAESRPMSTHTANKHIDALLRYCWCNSIEYHAFLIRSEVILKWSSSHTLFCVSLPYTLPIRHHAINSTKNSLTSSPKPEAWQFSFENRWNDLYT